MIDSTFTSQITALSEQPVLACYHCHKCTAGCPAAEDMQYGPDRVLRMIQLGQKRKLLESKDIWLCASCEVCGTRCPNEIDIANVMDALRQMALQENAAVGEPAAVKFHKLFIFLVQNMGRMHEVSLLAAYKLWSLNLFSDLDSGALMFVKNKIPLAPHVIKGRKDVKKLFIEVKRKEKV